MKLTALNRSTASIGILHSKMLINLARLLAIMSTGFLTACASFLCETLDPLSAAAVFEHGGPVIRVDAPQELVFQVTEAQLTARGYTLCNSLTPATAENLLEPCLGSCGATSSSRTGLVVAEKIFLSPRMFPTYEYTEDGYWTTPEGHSFKKIHASKVAEEYGFYYVELRLFAAIDESQDMTTVSYQVAKSFRGFTPESIYDATKVTGTDADAQYDREIAVLEQSLLSDIAAAATRQNSQSSK